MSHGCGVAEWVETEMETLALGDERLVKRGRIVLVSAYERPMASVWAMSEGTAEAKAAYRFLSNENVDPAAIREAAVDACRKRAEQEPAILAVQDTTSLDFSGHDALPLGPTGGGKGSSGNGLLVHSTIAVSHSGVPLGLLDQIDWVRDRKKTGSRHQRRELPIEEKESFRWILARRAVSELIPPSTRVIHVADREADIFEMFAEPKGENEFMLIRATRERCLEVADDAQDEDEDEDEEGVPEEDVTTEDKQVHTHLLAAVAAAPVVGGFDLQLKHGSTKRTPREARIALRVCQVLVKPPAHGVHDPGLQPVALTAVLAEEIDPPEKQKPISWLLLTDLDVNDAESARECVRLYSLRWLIERYHYVLKSGCRIEQMQLRSVEALRRLLALYCIVALRLLWITYAARTDGEQPCTVAYSTMEWKVLFRNFNRKDAFPDTPPPLKTVVLWTARLGGFKGRKGDGPPGVKAIWTGLSSLHYMVIGAALFAPEDLGKD